MHFPHFLSVKRDEKVFTEARELALLRLEQCVADLRIPAPATRTGTKQCVPTLVLNSDSAVSATQEIVNSLRASSGRSMRVTFSDGVVQTVIIGTTDEKGFLHCDADCADPQLFWTRFEDVNALEAAI